MLEREGSVASAIYRALKLDRAVIKAVFSALRDDRRKQVVFAGIVCGTAFKYDNKEGQKQNVRCPLCSAPTPLDLDHIKMHAVLGDTPREEGEDALVQYLCSLTETLAEKCPAVPTPMPLPDSEEECTRGCMV